MLYILYKKRKPVAVKEKIGMKVYFKLHETQMSENVKRIGPTWQTLTAQISSF